MTYSQPSIDTVNAYKNPAKGMDIVRTGLNPRSDVSKSVKDVDARDPSQIGRNAKLRTEAIDNFVNFLTEDIIPRGVDELKARGNAAAMEAVTSIPGMADGSFYRQSSEAQRTVLKDYNINGYALDQLKAYGASSAVGRYGQVISDSLAASPILQSNASQEERDAEKQRIFSDARQILQGVEPGYIAPYATKLAEYEGAAIGKTEAMAREARVTELKNTAISSSKELWTEAGGSLVSYDDLDNEQRSAAFAKGTFARLQLSLKKGLATMTSEEWYRKEEQGMTSALDEAISNNDSELAQTILASWQIANDIPLLTDTGYNVWDYGNKSGVDGRTNSEIVRAYSEKIDKLYDIRQGEIAIEASSDDIAAAIGGDQAALNRVNNTIMALYKDNQIKAAEALSAQITQEVRNSEGRFSNDVTELGRLNALRRDPNVSDEEYAQEVQASITARLISNGTGVSLVTSRFAPSELEKKRDAAIQYQESKTVGSLEYNSEGAPVFVQGENQNVNDVIKDARIDQPGVDDYLKGSFFGDLDVAVRGQFKEGEPMPSGEALRDIIEAESIKLIKKKTASLKADALTTKKGKIERSASIRQPIYDGINEGLSPEKIWGQGILDDAKESGKRASEIWKGRYAESLIGLDSSVKDDKGKYIPFTKESAAKEAQAELNRIRKKISEQAYSQSRPGSKGMPSSSSRPGTEISYDTELPGFEEELLTAAKNPDQDSDKGLLAVAGTNVLNALGRVLPGGGSPAAAATASSELSKAQTLQAIENSSGWKSLNRMFARRERVSATSPPLPQLSPTALTDTVPIAMTSDRHPFAVHIGIAEGTRTINGGYTRHYKGHTDPGDSHWNRGTFSGGRGMGNASPQQVDRYWMRELTARSARIAPAIARAGLRPGTVGYNRFMFNYLDLSVQAPLAADSFGAKLSSMKAGNWSIEVMAKARADSFYNPMTGRLEASGFKNNYSRLLGDQRSRAGVWDYKKRI